MKELEFKFKLNTEILSKNIQMKIDNCTKALINSKDLSATKKAYLDGAIIALEDVLKTLNGDIFNLITEVKFITENFEFATEEVIENH